MVRRSGHLQELNSNNKTYPVYVEGLIVSLKLLYHFTMTSPKSMTCFRSFNWTTTLRLV